jgi:hypothetical protein
MWIRNLPIGHLLRIKKIKDRRISPAFDPVDPASASGHKLPHLSPVVRSDDGIRPEHPRILPVQQ